VHHKVVYVPGVAHLELDPRDTFGVAKEMERVKPSVEVLVVVTSQAGSA